uniref:hypothetical protein n=1 Tax=Alloprevotella sp. TaxID=1872471 RepID=UPI003FF0C745
MHIQLSSTGPWKCFHWPVETRTLASGNTSTGQWTTTEWASLINYPTAVYLSSENKER